MNLKGRGRGRRNREKNIHKETTNRIYCNRKKFHFLKRAKCAKLKKRSCHRKTYFVHLEIMTKHILEYSSTFNKGNFANNFDKIGRRYGNGNKERQRKITKVSKLKQNNNKFLDYPSSLMIML